MFTLIMLPTSEIGEHFFWWPKFVLRLSARTKSYDAAVKAGAPTLRLVMISLFTYELSISKPSTELNRGDHGDHFHVYKCNNGVQLHEIVRNWSQRGVIWETHLICAPKSPIAFILPWKAFSKTKTSIPALVYCLRSNWANPTYWSVRSAGPNSIIFGSFDSARKTLQDEPTSVTIQWNLAKRSRA